MVFGDVFSSVYIFFLVNPLRTVYMQGPLSVGFWGGMGLSQICDVLSPLSPAMFWQQHIAECAELVDRRFQAFKVSVETVLYFIFLYQVCRFIWCVMCSLFTRVEDRIAPKRQILLVCE
jgi:hypothetical protein